MLAKKIIGTSVILGVLCVGVGFAATSAEARSGFIEKFTAKTYTGTVTSFDRDKLKIRTFDGKDVEVSTSKNTEFNEEVGEGDDVTIVTDGRGDKDKKAKKVKKEHKSRYGHDNRDNEHNNRDNEHSNRDHDKGYEDGHEDGYHDGHDNGKKDEKEDSYRNGHDGEYNNGYSEGYNKGFEEGKDDHDKEHQGRENNRR